MHHQIRESLENYLKGSASDVPAEFHAHLGECSECAGELRSIEAQSQLLRSLRDARGMEPRAGFYARVMERIEAQPASIWSVFLEPKFGFRLAVASAALAALLGTYLVTSEPSGPESGSAPVVVSTDIPQQQQQRDAVLVDLASYHQ
jgi:anti-sigma factor RsiW